MRGSTTTLGALHGITTEVKLLIDIFCVWRSGGKSIRIEVGFRVFLCEFDFKQFELHIQR